MAVFEEEPIIFDDGTGLIKAGFAGDDAPRLVFPPIVGRLKRGLNFTVPNSKSLYIGDDAATRSEYLDIRSPMRRDGTIDWEEMEHIWEYSFDELEADSQDRPLMISEPAQNSQTNREKVTEIMFEKFKVPCMYMATSALLSLYASGRSTGVVLDSGEHHTTAIPICEGYPVGRAIQRIDFGGADLTDWMVKLLSEEGMALYARAERETVIEIKETLGVIELDYTTAMTRKKGNTKPFVLPDGNTIDVGTSRFRCPEALFQPSLLGLEATGIHRLIYKAIQSSEIDARKELFSNIVLAGGSTMFPGIRDRLQKELIYLEPHNRVTVIAPPERKYLVWLGGSILGSLTAFQKMWISSDEYKESGATIIHTKPNKFFDQK